MHVVEFGELTDEHRHWLEGDELDPFDAARVTLHFRAKDHHVGLQDESGSLVASTFAILFCHEDRADLYRRLGFVELPGEVLVSQPSGYVPMTQLVMWIALHTDATWPHGKVIVHSLPF